MSSDASGWDTPGLPPNLLPWSQPAEDRLILRVRLTPKSARDQIECIEMLSDGTPILKVRVRAQPQDGEANRALLRLLAKSLQISPSALHLQSGASARLKILSVSGDSALLARRLAALTQSESKSRHAP